MIIIVTRPEIAAVLHLRWAFETDLKIFRDYEALQAFQAIVAHDTRVIALDPLFAATSRGATLIARVKADSRLAAADLRLLLLDDLAKVTDVRAPVPSFETTILALSRPLDSCGTRRSARFLIAPDAPAVINGVRSRLVDLSTTGVQLISPDRLRPDQAIRLTLVNDEFESRMRAVVAWCTFQAIGQAPSYRAGAVFVESDQRVIEGYCRRYGLDANQAIFTPAAPKSSDSSSLIVTAAEAAINRAGQRPANQPRQ